MSGIVARVLAAQTGEVEVGGIRWRIKAVRSEMVQDMRHYLLHVSIPSDEELTLTRAMAEWPAEERAAKEAEIAVRRAREALSPENLADAERRERALVCAGVTAAWNPDAGDGAGAWEDLALLMPGIATDTDAALSIEQLAPSVVSELSKAVWALSAGGDAAVKRIENFRRGS